MEDPASSLAWQTAHLETRAPQVLQAAPLAFLKNPTAQVAQVLLRVLQILQELMNCEQVRQVLFKRKRPVLHLEQVIALPISSTEVQTVHCETRSEQGEQAVPFLFRYDPSVQTSQVLLLVLQVTQRGMNCEQVRQTLLTRKVPRVHCEQVIEDPASSLAVQTVQFPRRSVQGTHEAPLAFL